MRDDQSAPDQRPDPLLRLVPPQAPEAERAVLGAVLIDGSALDVAAGKVGPQHFYNHAHVQIFAVLLELWEEDDRIDVVGLNERLAAKGVLDKVGGTAYLAELCEVVPTSANVGYYADKVHQAWLERELAVVGAKITALAWERGTQLDQRLNAAERLVYELSAERAGVVTVATAPDLAAMAVKHVALAQQGKGIVGAPTGFDNLDHLLGGLAPRMLTIVAGRPSMGKTTMALNMLRHMAGRGIRTTFLSLETPNELLGLSWVAALSKIPAFALRTGRLRAEENKPFADAVDRVDADYPGWRSVDSGIHSIMDLFRFARLWVRQDGMQVLGVDYLQLLSGSGEARSREAEVSEVSRGLKRLAFELNVHVIALAQINRRSEDRADHEPRLADLRESGQIEQDADAVVMIHRPGYYDEEADQDETNMLVVKNRHGPTGRCSLRFDKACGVFREGPSASG